MIRHRDGSTRREDTSALPTSVPDLGRLLRRERTRQGLSLAEVSARSGLDSLQLEALEAGTVDRLPDRVQTLKVLRAYSDFLGLPGERYVLALLEHWPVRSPAAAVVRLTPHHVDRIDDTASVRVASSSPATMNALATAQVPAVAAPAEESPPTGQMPALVNIPGQHLLAPPRSSPLLRAFIAALVLALGVGIAGIVVNQVEPQWLRDLGVTHGSAARASARLPVTPHGRLSVGSGRSRTIGHRPVPSGRPKRSVAPVVQIVDLQPQSVTLAVRARSFVVGLAAIGGPSWMQVSAPDAAPIFSEVVPAGGRQVFPVKSALVVEVGASSARAFVSVGNRLVGGYAPPAAPFTMTFQSSG